ncbi:MAG: Phosphoribosylformylglycinamidine synthase, synthetase subunit [Myxococcaceae bacterium]|nr:Phosphoribosylformylglycinamidine synthase, synthetase subunit [Myxococcaceae bacterium]
MATAKKTDTKVVPFPGDPEVTAELSHALGLTEAELARAHKELGRNLTHAELGVLAQMWSESESQKLSRSHTRRLPTTGPHVLRGLSDAAGALDLGDGFCAVVGLGRVRSLLDDVRGASPSASDALRDVIALGAKPLALLDSVRLGAADDRQTAQELKNLADILSAYARDVGVPVVGGDLKFERRYAEQPLVQMIALGVVRTEAALESKATGLGNTIVCVGTAAAARGTDEAPAADDVKAAASHDAVALKRLGDACLAAFRLGSVEGAHAVGAAGIAGAALRLAESGSTGIELDLDLITRHASASPYELMCAAGGQRMLLVVKKGREDNVLETFRSHELDARVIGRVTNTERLVCKATADQKQAVVFDLPVALLTRDAPSYERPVKAVQLDSAKPEITLKRNEDIESELSRLLGSANVGSRDWLLRRLETGKSSLTKGPLGDAVVLRATLDDGARGSTSENAPEKFVAVAVDGNARYLELDPRQGAAMAVAECARNLVCVGAEPLGLAHSLTLGLSDQPEAMFRLSNAVDGIRDACLSLKLPVIASSVTLSERDVPNTPIIAVVGQLRNANERIGMGFGRQADTVALLGAAGTGNIAGSEFVAAREVTLRGAPLTLDLAAEVKLQRAVLELARDRLLSSAHDVSEGGLGVALAECCIAGKIGCSVELPADAGGADSLHQLFHEEPSRIVVSFPPEQRAKVQERCTALGVPFQFLGFVGGDTLEIEEVLEVPVQVLAESHSRALERLVSE